MELNAEQIKKALEICGNEELDTCKGCPYAEDFTNCNKLIAKDALSLIKTQEQRIKELEAELAEAEAEADKAIDIAEGNIRAEIASGGTSCHWCEDKVRADTVRKMQEELCEGRVSNDPVVIAVNVAAKELLEGKQ